MTPAPSTPARPVTERMNDPFADATRPPRRNPAVRRVIARWRALTGGPATRDPDRGTLVACSGGADSAFLAAALAATKARIVIAHVRHDLRPAAEAAADEAHTAALARFLDRPFVRTAVHTADHPGNAESNARTARYTALAALAEAQGLALVATAHHADDQLETLLMRLLRGAGHRGMAGIRERRRLDAGRTLIRPMLTTTADHARETLRNHTIPWIEDRTNADTTRLRAALRHDVLPTLRGLQPTAAAAAARSAALLADADTALRAAARALPTLPADAPAPVPTPARRWPRDTLRATPAAVVAEALRLAAHELPPASCPDRRSPTQPELTAATRRTRSADPVLWTGRLGACTAQVHPSFVQVEFPLTGAASPQHSVNQVV